MGSLYKNGRIRNYIMIFLVLVALIISVPVKKMITGSVNARITEFTDLLYEKTGLTITYKSLSPSILSSFYIYDITLLDKEDAQLLYINKTKISYNLINLLHHDFQKGLSSIIVDGINLDVDGLIKLSNLFVSEESSQLNLAELRTMIPASIKLKNIRLEYADENASALLVLKNFFVTNSLNKNTVDIQANVNVNAEIKALSKTFTGKMELAGAITQDINDSQLNLKIRDFTDGDLKLNKLNLHAAYTDGRVEVHTIQAVNPVSFSMFYDFNTSDANMQLRTENLKPVSLVSVTSRQKQIQNFKNLRLDTDTIVKCNLNEKSLNFFTENHVFIPQEVFPGSIDLSLSLFGDEKKAELTDFSIKGPRCSANAKLSFTYLTKQLSGYIELPEFILDNGKALSTELYFDPLDKGFMVFSPQLFLGDRSLTALQLTVNPLSDSYDFSFEAYDYSHLEEIEPGTIKMEGSFLNASKYFQANITLASLYLDSIALAAGQVLDKKEAEVIDGLQTTLSPYLLSGDIYASTDLKTFSYNVPYVLLANSSKDNQALMFSLNGNDKNIQLNQLSLILGQYALEASASLDQAPDSSDTFFTVDINAASIPYHFAGTIMPEVCTLTGDYGTDIEIRFNEKKNILGHFICKNFPVKLFNTSLILTSDSDFSYSQEDGPALHLANLEIEEAGSGISINPKVVLSGNATQYGASLSSIAYTDLYSTMEGSADLLLNFNGSVFDSVGLMLNVRNPITEEGITLDGSVSNPDRVSLNKDNFLDSIYLNLQMQLNNFSLNRFLAQKNDNNMVSGMLFASGTLEHPYLALSVESLSMLMAADMFKANGNIILEDRNLTLNDVNLDFDYMKVNNIQAQASLSDMTLDASGEFIYNLMDRNIYAPLQLTAGNAIIPEGSFLPDSISVTLSSPEVRGSLIKKRFPFQVSALYSNDVFSIFSSDNIGLYGTFTKDGLLELNIDNKSFASAKVDGIINDVMNFEVYDISIDLPSACKYLNIDDLMIVDNGLFTGDIIFSGTSDDPDINGNAVISSPALRMPILTKQKLTAPDIIFTITNNEIQMAETILTAKNNQRLQAWLSVFLNKWTLDHVDASFRTFKKDQFPVSFKTDALSLDGNISADINLYFENDVLEVSGNISGENVDLGAEVFALSNMAAEESEKDDEEALSIVTDLNITLGTHASIRLDPLLRCIFVPNTTINVKINQNDASYVVDGELNLKSGDLAYLNRSFYIKSGSIKFNKNDIANPIITVNAETREKADDGSTVKIVMSVENQYLMDMQPRFTSVPPKSENEIRTLLGQIVIADSNNAADLLFAASDYALQSTVMRKAENKLRDLMNFDIFSLRTNVIQNTYNLSISRNFTRESISIGNFLDNTTVYIGKYLGSSLYVDAMLHVSLEDNKSSDISAAGAMMFQPEFGMELESPFANIRVNMAPDINSLLKNQFVPSTSVTLSWKFTY